MKNIRTEILAGLTTFSTMAYIIVVNPMILSEAHMDLSAVMMATILITFFASCFMGVVANYPVAIAPGMGVSAYFAYSVVLGLGKTWQEALAAVFIVGSIVFILSIFAVRKKIIHSFPACITKAATAGIGFFLIFVGLRILKIVTIAVNHSFISVMFDHFLSFEILFAVMSFVGIIILMRKQIRGAFIIIILLNWMIAVIFGFVPWKGIVAMPPSLQPTFLQMDFSHILQMDFLGVLFSIFLISLFDSSTSLISLAKQLRFVDKKGEILRLHRAVLADGLGSMIGACLGTGSLSYHLESTSGIKEGGRTGITAVVVGFCFLLCVFFYPLVSSIPHFASAPILIYIAV